MIRLSKMRLVVAVAVVGVAVGVVMVGPRLVRKITSKQAASPANRSSLAQTPSDTIRLIASGDIITHDAINQAALKADGSYDYYQFMNGMQPLFDKADVRFCNNAVPAAGASFGISGYPVFNAPFDLIKDISRLGCNVINTGTNHTNDKGQAAINAWLDQWDRQKNILAVAGANRSVDEQNRVRYFETKGVKFAMLSYTTYSNSSNATSYGVNMFSEEFAKRQLTEARSKADVVLVSMRWGTEYSPAINEEQSKVGQFLADNGADVVLGHGPHVLEPIQRLKGVNGRETLVWYSLGNFLNAQLETEALFSGIAVMNIDRSSKTIKEVSYLPIYMHYEWTADQKARQDLLKRHAFKLYPLDQAAELLKKSQLNTTVEAQRDRITKLLNQFTSVKFITSDAY